MDKKKIKIAHIITRLDRGGAPDIIRSIFIYSDNPNYDFRLIYGSTVDPSAETKIFLTNNQEKITLIKELKRNINFINDAVAFFKLFFLFKKEKFDIVHTHTAKAGILGRIAAKLSGIRFIAHTPHGHNFYGYFGSLGSQFVVMIERLLAHITDRIIVLTKKEKEDYLKFGVGRPSKLSIVVSGIELRKYINQNIDVRKKKEEFGINENDLAVGMIGRFEEIKGPEYLIKAAPYILEEISEVKFLMIGDGSLKGKLEALSKKLNIRDRFFFSGWREDVPEILQVLDVIVQPSLNEAVGRILLEAGVAGKATVATDVGGVSSIVEDGRTGMLVSARDFRGLAKAIVSLLKDNRKRLEMGKAAKESVTSSFTVEAMVQGFYNLYRELIKV